MISLQQTTRKRGTLCFGVSNLPFPRDVFAVIVSEEIFAHTLVGNVKAYSAVEIDELLDTKG